MPMTAEALASWILDGVNSVLFDKSVSRETCIEAMEIAYERLGRMVESLKADQKRARP